MDVDLLHIGDCPNWRETERDLRDLIAGSADVVLRVHEVTSAGEAVRVGFGGSPTVLVDGRDPFPADSTTGLACRVYATPEGLRGRPTRAQLRAALGLSSTEGDA